MTAIQEDTRTVNRWTCRCGQTVLAVNRLNHLERQDNGPHGDPGDPTPRHGDIAYDDQEQWLVETDDEGASQIVAMQVPRWFGRLVVAALEGTSRE